MQGHYKDKNRGYQQLRVWQDARLPSLHHSFTPALHLTYGTDQD